MPFQVGAYSSIKPFQLLFYLFGHVITCVYWKYFSHRPNRLSTKSYHAVIVFQKTTSVYLVKRVTPKSLLGDKS